MVTILFEITEFSPSGIPKTLSISYLFDSINIRTLNAISVTIELKFVRSIQRKLCFE